MTRHILNIQDLTGGLSWQKVQYVIELTKDWNCQRAAMASGFSPSEAVQLREEPAVQAAIEKILQYRLEQSHIDADWLLMEAVDNHMIARQLGNITASNTALNLIAKHATVDAFAAEKVEVATDREVLERLQRGRKRLSKRKQPPPDDEEVSFL